MRVQLAGTLTLLGLVAVVVSTGTPDPEALVERLGAASARERDEAARGLRDLGAGAEAALAAASFDGDPAVRERAAALLALLGDRADSTAREQEAEAVVRSALGAPRGLRPGSLHDARLRDLAPEAGAALAAAAVRLAEHGFVPDDVTQALARHASRDTLAALVGLLGRERLLPSGGVAAARELERGIGDDPARREALRSMAEPVLPVLRPSVRQGRAPMRRAAVSLYAALARDDAVAVLSAALEDPDPSVRAEAARALGRHAAAPAADALRGLVSDPAEAVREAALDALAAVPGIPHPEPAVACAQDGSPAVRAAAAALLARDGTPETLPVLEALSRDPSPRVRAAARRALRR